MICLNKSIPLVLILALGACANAGANYQPVVDGPKGPAYEADLADCQALAASQPTVDGNTAGAAATGAVGGAATSAILNDTSDDIGRAAAVGIIAGLTADQVRKNNKREAIVKGCMRGRGHKVIA